MVYYGRIRCPYCHCGPFPVVLATSRPPQTGELFQVLCPEDTPFRFVAVMDGSPLPEGVPAMRVEALTKDEADERGRWTVARPCR
jgi:hypothetical protein